MATENKEIQTQLYNENTLPKVIFLIYLNILCITSTSCVTVCHHKWAGTVEPMENRALDELMLPLKPSIPVTADVCTLDRRSVLIIKKL